MLSIRIVDDLIDRWNCSTLCCINKYKLDKKIILLVMLFYQYCFLRNSIGCSEDETTIIHSYLEDNIHLCVAIVSQSNMDGYIRIKRFILKEEIYNLILGIYGKQCYKDLIINTDVINTFSRLQSLYKID